MLQLLLLAVISTTVVITSFKLRYLTHTLTKSSKRSHNCPYSSTKPLPSLKVQNDYVNVSSDVDDTIIDLLYDSECPICQMEVNFLQKRDINHRIRFTDLSSPSYDPVEHGNVSFERGMRKIRAVLPDKTVVTGVEVFRRTYEAIGLGWMFEITKLPLVGTAADALYDLWAENRLRLTGRGDLADVLKDRSDTLRNSDPTECDTDACEIDWDAIPITTTTTTAPATVDESKP